ncbi:hypothetical protein C8J57DRAFT_1211407 [Mycena rebaudengoi]|nr:hypothetical protein C8J57DRAFT_1211407 [Mycena rebaudengoi]
MSDRVLSLSFAGVAVTMPGLRSSTTQFMFSSFSGVVVTKQGSAAAAPYKSDNKEQQPQPPYKSNEDQQQQPPYKSDDEEDKKQPPYHSDEEKKHQLPTLSDSGSGNESNNYSATEHAQKTYDDFNKLKTTEEADADDDADFNAESKKNGLSAKVKGKAAATVDKGKGKDRQPARTDKGKGKAKPKTQKMLKSHLRAVELNSDNIDADNEDDNDKEDHDKPEGGYTRGPVPAELVERALSAHGAYQQQLQDLAKNTWNQYQMWYAHKGPTKKAQDMLISEWNCFVRREYEAKIAQMPEGDCKDLDALKAHFAEVIAWNHAQMVVELDHQRAEGKFAVIVAKYVKQLNSINGGGSLAWGGSPAYKDIQENDKVNVKLMLRDWESKFQQQDLAMHEAQGKLDTVDTVPRVDSLPKLGETDCAQKCRMWILWLRPELVILGLEAGWLAQGEVPQFEWDFPKMCFCYKIRGVNWPNDVTDAKLLPRTGRNNKMPAKPFNKLFMLMEKRHTEPKYDSDNDDQIRDNKKTKWEVDGDQALRLESWTEEEVAMSLKEQGEIAVLTTVNGQQLQFVKDAKSYQDALQREKDGGATKNLKTTKTTKSTKLGKTATSPSPARSPPPEAHRGCQEWADEHSSPEALPTPAPRHTPPRGRSPSPGRPPPQCRDAAQQVHAQDQPGDEEERPWKCARFVEMAAAPEVADRPKKPLPHARFVPTTTNPEPPNRKRKYTDSPEYAGEPVARPSRRAAFAEAGPSCLALLVTLAHPLSHYLGPRANGKGHAHYNSGSHKSPIFYISGTLMQAMTEDGWQKLKEHINHVPIVVPQHAQYHTLVKHEFFAKSYEE